MFSLRNEYICKNLSFSPMFCAGVHTAICTAATLLLLMRLSSNDLFPPFFAKSSYPTFFFLGINLLNSAAKISSTSFPPPFLGSCTPLSPSGVCCWGRSLCLGAEVALRCPELWMSFPKRLARFCKTYPPCEL